MAYKRKRNKILNIQNLKSHHVIESPYAFCIFKNMNYVVLKHVLMIFKLGSAYDVMRLKILTHKETNVYIHSKLQNKICDWDKEKTLNCAEQLPLYDRIE